MTAITKDRTPRRWPVLLLALPAFVAIWSGWVGLGELTGFGPVRPLPGLADSVTFNSAVTLPIGMETYAAYALHVWLSGTVRTDRTRSYTKFSALGALFLGAAGQVAFHLMHAASITAAPWPVTVAVACIPVLVLGMGATLAHMLMSDVHAMHDADAQPVHGEVLDAAPMHDHDALPVHAAAAVRTLSVREVHTETHETATELTARTAAVHEVCTTADLAHADRWTDAAVQLCDADTSNRRNPRTVAEILRLHHEDGWPHTRIGEHVGCSASTVSRTISAARIHIEAA
ncbi:helix-turn-helix domain-containing protein [Nocardia sp. NPDC049737]|uniref:helix-turn-helix domain-containing protein n=1 Tax=Nocardia sp. NPDC049737 TaxID=3154358 RepID=UPI003449CADA